MPTCQAGAQSVSQACLLLLLLLLRRRRWRQRRLAIPFHVRHCAVCQLIVHALPRAGGHNWGRPDGAQL
jgi:hypothetical protein